ncbi:phosphotransferase [Streptomyces sp. T-3]|nr:phosphotransferase [Streptomyces sp. T-3]
MNATSVRPDWAALPDEVRAHAEEQMGSPVAEAQTCGGGFTPGLASRLLLTDGRRMFLKGMDGSHPFAPQYADEVAITSALPEGVGPRVLWWAAPCEDMEWWLLCLEDVPGSPPDLSPAEDADTEAVVKAVERAGKMLTPCPVDAAHPIGDILGRWFTGWRDLAEEGVEDLDPWAARNLTALASVELQWQPEAAGDSLIHWDLRPDNMIRRPDGSVLLIDWSYPFQGAGWIDPVSLIPALMVAGHSAAQAEASVQHLPHPSADALTAFAAGLAGYWTRLPAGPILPESPFSARVRRPMPPSLLRG